MWGGPVTYVRVLTAMPWHRGTKRVASSTACERYGASGAAPSHCKRAVSVREDHSVQRATHIRVSASPIRRASDRIPPTTSVVLSSAAAVRRVSAFVCASASAAPVGSSVICRSVYRHLALILESSVRCASARSKKSLRAICASQRDVRPKGVLQPLSPEAHALNTSLHLRVFLLLRHEYDLCRVGVSQRGQCGEHKEEACGAKL
jgi:hypothetical protein